MDANKQYALWQAQRLPDDLAAEFTGVWSKELSGENGMLSSPPVLSITFSEAHTSAGLTLTFSEATEDWCSSLNIIWYDQAGDRKP